MSQDVNMIITCDSKECQYNYEGECGKDVLFIDDVDCLEQEKFRLLQKDVGEQNGQ